MVNIETPLEVEQAKEEEKCDEAPITPSVEKQIFTVLNEHGKGLDAYLAGWIRKLKYDQHAASVQLNAVIAQRDAKSLEISALNKRIADIEKEHAQEIENLEKQVDTLRDANVALVEEKRILKRCESCDTIDNLQAQNAELRYTQQCTCATLSQITNIMNRAAHEIEHLRTSETINNARLETLNTLAAMLGVNKSIRMGYVDSSAQDIVSLLRSRASEIKDCLTVMESDNDGGDVASEEACEEG